jgi:hypothetical protein
VVPAPATVEASGDEMAFLPALAFATILLTNLVVVGGSLSVHHRAAAALSGAGAGASRATGAV